MLTKLDKNLANYLVNNKIYFDFNPGQQQQQQQQNNSSNNLDSKPGDFHTSHSNKTSENELKVLNEDESMINSLPDMNEIENYGNLTNMKETNFQIETQDCNAVTIKCNQSFNKSHLPLSPSDSSSSSSASTPLSSNESNITNQAFCFKEYENDDDVPSLNKKLLNRNIHCVKEKIRRDRIKFSCNELRRLIPNLNGVKTDMASLLETSVLWIQLINTTIPEQLLINVQRKLESFKLLRNNKQYLAAQKNVLTSPIESLKIRNKNVSESNEFNGKHEVFSQIQANNVASLNSSLNSSYLSSIDTSTPVPYSQQHAMISKRTNNSEIGTNNLPNNNFMSKPSKWLTLSQHKYSDLYSNRAVLQQQEQDLPDQRFFITANNNHSDCDLFNKIAKKHIEYNNNNNNLYFAQPTYSDQYENYLQCQQTNLFDNQDTEIHNSTSTPNYFPITAPSNLSTNCQL